MAARVRWAINAAAAKTWVLRVVRSVNRTGLVRPIRAIDRLLCSPSLHRETLPWGRASFIKLASPIAACAEHSVGTAIISHSRQIFALPEKPANSAFFLRITAFSSPGFVKLREVDSSLLFLFQQLKSRFQPLDSPQQGRNQSQANGRSARAAAPPDSPVAGATRQTATADPSADLPRRSAPPARRTKPALPSTSPRKPLPPGVLQISLAPDIDHIGEVDDPDLAANRKNPLSPVLIENRIAGDRLQSLDRSPADCGKDIRTDKERSPAASRRRPDIGPRAPRTFRATDRSNLPRRPRPRRRQMSETA